MRDIVLKRKMPRRNLVQPHVYMEDGELTKIVIPLGCLLSVYLLGCVKLQDFQASVEGVVQSFVARYPSSDPDFEELWQRDRHHWM